MRHKVMFAVYHNCNSEARSAEELRCCSQIGETHLVSYAAPADAPANVKCHLVDKKNPLALLAFLAIARSVIRREKPDLILLHDNSCAILIPYAKKYAPHAKIVYDSSELYISEGKSLAFRNAVLLDKIKIRLTSFRRRSEKKYLRLADLVVAANIERAKIMQKYFGLKELPYIFDNIHRIDDEYDLESCRMKYDIHFPEACFNILFAGGISRRRRTLEYIEAFKKLPDQTDYNLVILGNASTEDMDRYRELTEGCLNIRYLGFVSRAELRYCLNKAQASVVIFDTNTLNNLYCASGKCYESLFEGTPILASENPPLKRLCEEEKVGVSDDDFGRAILTLRNGYASYRQNVAEYVEKLNYEFRLDDLRRVMQRQLMEV